MFGVICDETNYYRLLLGILKITVMKLIIIDCCVYY